MEFDPHKKPTYIFRHPFRFVKPYSHEYKTFAKKRWLGRKILEVLSKQFQAYSQQYFKQAIISGKITINEKIVGIDYIFKNSDSLSHSTVREEPPILDLPIEIIHEDDEFLVVCKPPSMVVHTGGGYHYNTLLAILHYEMGYQNLFILHRIDRLTSGVVLLSKKKEKATKFHEQSVQQVMKKCYFARVSGDVQFEEKTVEVPMVCISHKQGVWSVFDHQTMQQFLMTQQPKQSLTKFTKIWYDKQTDSSLLECLPVTGRTHQIRVHLKYLGHPILNDTVYGGRFVGNQIVQKISKLKEEAENNKEIGDKVCKRIKQGQKTQKQSQSNEEDGIQYEKWDFENKSLEIFLHSYKYRFQDKQYVSRKPYWVQKHSLNTQKWNNQKQQKVIEAAKDYVKSKYEKEFLDQRIVKKTEKVQQEIKNQDKKDKKI